MRACAPAPAAHLVLELGAVIRGQFLALVQGGDQVGVNGGIRHPGDGSVRSTPTKKKMTPVKMAEGRPKKNRRKCSRARPRKPTPGVWDVQVFYGSCVPYHTVNKIPALRRP